MLATELAERIGAKVVAVGAPQVAVARVYAGDRVSDLLIHASDRTLLVTNLTGAQVLRLAEVTELACICFVNGTAPPLPLANQASGSNVVVMVSPHGLYETCGRLYAAMANGR
jgi:hypothetical protein